MNKRCKPMIKGGTGQRSLLFFFAEKRLPLLTAASFQEKVPVKKGGGCFYLYQKTAIHGSFNLPFSLGETGRFHQVIMIN